ncbi:hypothetical protein [Nostoc sp. JL34]
MTLDPPSAAGASNCQVYIFGGFDYSLDWLWSLDNFDFYAIANTAR